MHLDKQNLRTHEANTYTTEKNIGKSTITLRDLRAPLKVHM
jgi:hypothetical protein